MGLELTYVEGQTPLNDDEKDGLLIPSITSKGELDEAEQRNIEDAILWLTHRRKKFTVREILNEKFICDLHRKMFSGVWRWAGTFRNTERNLGVKSYLIPMELRTLLDDCKYWIENETFSADEIAVRFKHRIVVIHCFASGNGRHSRLMADVLGEKVLGCQVFSWGGNGLAEASNSRKAYVAALRSADKNDYAALITFARM